MPDLAKRESDDPEVLARLDRALLAHGAMPTGMNTIQNLVWFETSSRDAEGLLAVIRSFGLTVDRCSIDPEEPYERNRTA